MDILRVVLSGGNLVACWYFWWKGEKEDAILHLIVSIWLIEG